MPSQASPLLEALTGRASTQGLNLAGLVAVDEYDRCQPPGQRAGELLPGCETILVIASGGRGFWEKTDGGGRSPRWPDHPLHRRTVAVVKELRATLSRHGWPCRAVYPGRRPTLNFRRMGEMAGLGTISPVVGMLVHPDYGLWVSFRAALLVAGTPFGTDWKKPVPPAFQPCATCARPCVDACPVQVYDGRGQMHLHQCARHRHTGGCAHGCDARRACPVGAEHRYGPVEEAFRHTHALAAMRRHYGLGTWRLVPRAVRHR
jgi:hypothetical protein